MLGQLVAPCLACTAILRQASLASAVCLGAGSMLFSVSQSAFPPLVQVHSSSLPLSSPTTVWTIARLDEEASVV